MDLSVLKGPAFRFTRSAQAGFLFFWEMASSNLVLSLLFGVFFPKTSTNFSHHASILLKKAEHSTLREGPGDWAVGGGSPRSLPVLGVQPLPAGCQVALHTA